MGSRSPAQAWTGYVMVVGAATLWGANGSLMRAILDHGLSDARLAAVRLTGTALILLGWVAWRARDTLVIDRREAVAYASFGVLGLVAVQYLFVVAVARMDVALVLVIEYVAPLLVMVWAVAVFREHVPRLVWLLTLAALVGLALALGVGGDTLDTLSGVGIAAALAAAAAYAYYVLHAERLLRVRPGPSVVALGMGFGAIFWAVAQPWWSFPTEALTDDVPLGGNLDVGIPGWLALAVMIVAGTVIPFVLMLGGLRRVRATGASVTAMLEPVVAGAVAWVWLEQSLSPLQVAGGLVVIAAVLAAQLARARAAQPPPTG